MTHKKSNKINIYQGYDLDGKHFEHKEIDWCDQPINKKKNMGY